jgi:integrase
MKIEVFRNKLRVRFTHINKRYALTIGDNDPQSYELGRDIISRIKADIKAKTFDKSLQVYKDISTVPAFKNFPLAEYYNRWLLTFGNSIPYNVVTTQRMINNWGIKSANDICSLLVKHSLAPNTFNCRLNILKRFIKWAIKKGIILEDPLEDICRLKVKSKREQRKPFQDEEIAMILDAFSSNKYHKNASKYFPFLKFMFLTGVRNAEAIGLQVKKIDFKKKLILIDQTLARTRKGSYANAREFKSTKTNNSRFLPMDGDLEHLLREVSGGKRGNDLVFTSVNGKAIDDHLFQKRVFKPILKRLGIPERDLYATRHTFGTLSIEQGLNPIEVGYLMGHNNPKTVLTCYSHLRNIPKSLPSIIGRE